MTAKIAPVKIETKADGEWTNIKGSVMISAMNAARAPNGRHEVTGTVECFFESPELYEFVQNSRLDLIEHFREMETNRQP